MSDPFRPRGPIARIFYDALLSASYKRHGNPQWVEQEHVAMLDICNSIRAEIRKPQVTLDDIERVETTALGHTDYAAKFARALRDLALGNRE